MATAKGQGGRGKGEERSVEGDIDALFQLPLTEFTAARNALAARLKKAGRADESGAVKALSKPPMSAWAVNQLFWRNRDAFDRLISTGEQFRKAQAAQLSGKSADLRGPLEARRSALADLSRLAASLLRDGGSQPAPDTMRRVTTTLEALSTYGEVPNAPRAGRLIDDVDPPGFETLAALVPTIGKGKSGSEPTRIIPFKAKPPKAPKRKPGTEEDAKRIEEERRAQLAVAKAAVQEAERSLRDARKSAQEAESALKKAAARAKEADSKRAEAELRLEKAAADADAARKDARHVAAEAEDAAQAVEDAERTLEKARTDLKALS
jgi:hypothetical protein